MANTDAFDSWLFERLKDLNTDETVFGPYIKSIVESDEDPGEKEEGLDGLLLELVPEDEVFKLRDEILKRWASCTGKSASEKPGILPGDANGQVGNLPDKIDHISSLDSKMEALLRMSDIDHEQSKQKDLQNGTKGSSVKGAVDSELRAAILSQYRDREDDSDSENEHDKPRASGKAVKVEIGGVGKNMNAEKVLAEQREAKEKARAEQAKKKEKDKEDRVKQKKVAEDRKEKAKKKATKVERKC